MSDVLAGSNTTGAMPSPKPIVTTSAESPQEVGFTWTKDSVSKMQADKNLTGSRGLTVRFSGEAAGPGLLPSPGKVGASPILKSDASSTLVSGNVLCFEGPIELDPEDEKTYKDSDNKKCSFCGWFTGTDSLCFSFSHRLLQETQVSTRKSLHIKGTLLRI